jgi:diguanylate cyclase (GGDEF)-like protein
MKNRQAEEPLMNGANMATIKSMDTNIISLIILILIYANVYRQTDKAFYNNKTFVHLLQTNIALIILDQLGVVSNGTNGFFVYAGSAVSNVMLFTISPLASILWLKYISFQIFNNEGRIKKWQWLFYSIFTLNAIASVVSIRTGWFFYIDSQNIYSRGTYFLIHIVFIYALVIYAVYFIMINRSKIERKVFYSLLLFPIPPVLGTIIQFENYGVSYGWDGVTISLLIIYFNIQDRNLNTDYLTGIYNRRQLDSLIKLKIRTLTGFSAILIDINSFKAINDNYGHDVGDEALMDAVKIIKKSLRHNDFVARFGGDEFFIILDINEYPLLNNTVERIKDSANNFNLSRYKPYSISFSMGYDIYNPQFKMSADEFFKHIDQLMYLEKYSNS